MYKATLLPLFLFSVWNFTASARAQTPASTPLDPQQLVQDAMQKQRAGDLAGAVPEYQEFLKLHPEATAIHSNLGAALAGLGRYEEAVAEYKIALKQSPRLPSARLNLALAYYKMGRIPDAAVQLERVHAEDPSNHQATIVLGDAYLRMDKNKDVIRVLAPEAKKYPDDLAIAYMLGTAYIRNKQVEPGQVLVDRILRNGDSAEAHLMLGTAKMNIQDFAGARDEFGKAVALNPNLSDARVLYAQALHLTGDSEQSSKEYEAGLAQDPYNFEANLQLGANAREEHDYQRAEQYFKRAMETRPGDPGVLYQLALIDADQSRLEAARQKLEALVKEYPEFTEAHVSLSLVYYRLKRPQDGKREHEVVLKLNAEAQAKQPGVKQQ
jgi:tetratricopeptide (TPR) repeat protein